NIMLIFLSELGTKPSLGERGSRRACLYDSGSAGASPSRPIGAKLAPDCERYGRLCRVPDLRFTICQDLLAVSEYPTNVRERYRSLGDHQTMEYMGGLICFLPVALVSLATTVFWLWTLIDCISKEPSTGNE